MSSKVIINLADLERFINALNTFNQELETQSSNLIGEFNQLGETWRDEAYIRFADYFEELINNLKRFQEVTEGDTLPYLIALRSRILDVLDTYR